MRILKKMACNQKLIITKGVLLITMATVTGVVYHTGKIIGKTTVNTLFDLMM